MAADSKSLTRSIRVLGKVEPIYVEDVDRLAEAIVDVAQDNDVVLVMGAGSIARVPAALTRIKNRLSVVNGHNY